MEKILNAKRSRILETALQLFVKQGLQQTPMAQISKDSGVAVGTMYHHFKSKDELIGGLYLQIQEEFGQHISFSEEEKKLPIKKCFEILWRKSYDYYTTHPDKFIFAHTHIYSPLISQELRDEGRQHYSEAIAFIQEGIAEKAFVQTHVVVLMRWYYLSVAALVQIKIANEIKVTDQLIKTGIEMAWNAIAAK